MNKIKKLMRRFILGKSLRHQYTCHPSFNIRRDKDQHDIIWKGNLVGQVQNIQQANDIAITKDCFVIASGPSLNEIDFGRLSGQDTLSLNCAIKKFESHNMAPTHSLIVDRRIFEKHWDCIEASILSGANCFFSYVGLSRICERDPSLLKHNNIYLVEPIGRFFNLPRPKDTKSFQALFENDDGIYLSPSHPSRGTIGYSLNPTKGFFTGKTVATWALQLTPYIGYTNTYILGMDLGGTGQQHFYSGTQQLPYDFLELYKPYIEPCFQLARQASDEHAFSFFNLSEFSTLPNEIIEKISFDEALSNTEHVK